MFGLHELEVMNASAVIRRLMIPRLQSSECRQEVLDKLVKIRELTCVLFNVLLCEAGLLCINCLPEPLATIWLKNFNLFWNRSFLKLSDLQPNSQGQHLLSNNIQFVLSNTSSEWLDPPPLFLTPPLLPLQPHKHQLLILLLSSPAPPTGPSFHYHLHRNLAPSNQFQHSPWFE